MTIGRESKSPRDWLKGHMEVIKLWNELKWALKSEETVLQQRVLTTGGEKRTQEVEELSETDFGISLKTGIDLNTTPTPWKVLWTHVRFQQHIYCKVLPYIALPTVVSQCFVLFCFVFDFLHFVFSNDFYGCQTFYLALKGSLFGLKSPKA